MPKLNGKELPDMSRNKAPYRGNARFIELGSLGAPFRSLVNVDHISNVRFEQKIGQSDAQYDDKGEMTAPPQQWHEGWVIVIVIGHGAGGQNIQFPDEEQAVTVYNTILDMISGTGAPIARMPKLKAQPPIHAHKFLGPDGEPLPEQSELLGPDGEPLMAANGEDDSLPGEVPDLTDEELDQLENPEIDVDAIAEAVEDGLGAEPVDDKG
jgi:hypothetical protein